MSVTALPFGVFFGFSFGGDLTVEGRKAVEEELGDVSKGDGVLAIDALQGDVAEQVAEEEVDGVRCGEIVQVREKGFGDGSVLAAWQRVESGSEANMRQRPPFALM